MEKHGVPSLVLIQQTIMSQFGNKFAVKPSRLTEVSKHLPHIVRTLRKNKFFRLRQLWNGFAVVHVCHVRTGQSFHSGFEIHSDNVGQAVDCVSAAVFFAVEYLFEQKVVVTSTETVSKLADWQMYLCYIPPEEDRYVTETLIRTEKPIEILIGEYNPAFKLHFYIISIVIIVCLLNCIYGFAELIRSGKKEKTKALVLQSISSVVFVGLCLLACFTAFWRDGQITVSLISAFLMILFFIVLGLNVGVFVGSFLLGKKVLISCGIPALVSAALTTLMYVGELILLHGHLYRFGSGFFFDALPSIVFAPVDICVIILSGALAFLLMKSVNCNPKKNF